MDQKVVQQQVLVVLSSASAFGCGEFFLLFVPWYGTPAPLEFHTTAQYGEKIPHRQKRRQMTIPPTAKVLVVQARARTQCLRKKLGLSATLSASPKQQL